MFIRIYFGSKPLFLCDQVDAEIEPYVHHDDSVYIDELNTHTIKTILHEMELPGIHAGVFFHEDLDKLRETFFKKFTIVKAAGGLVRNPEGALLLIFRRGKWDLPKGKLDPGETLEDCAVREVQEETGLRDVKRDKPLLVTYHTYHEGTRFILKESHWYTMHVEQMQELTPQREEDIHEVRWVQPAELPGYFSNTFPSVIDVLKTALPE